MKLKRRKSYKNYFILLFFVIVIFIVLNLVNSNHNINIDLFGKVFNNETILKNGKEYYLPYDFIKENIDNEIYFDNASRKVVISSDIGLFKAKVDDKIITNNFKEENIESIGIIEEKNKYMSLELLRKAYGLNIEVSNNTIYIFENENFECKVVANNIGVYKEGNIKSSIVDYVDKKDKLVGCFENEEYVFVKINDNSVGYISKDMLNYSKKEDGEEIEEIVENKEYIFADNTNQFISKDLSIDGVFVNLFDVTQINSNVNVRNLNNKFLSDTKEKGYKIYGIVTNGYSLAGFNTSTISQILSDESKRMSLINNLTEKIKEYNLDGIVLDFRMIKETDTNNYVQFVKEFNAFCSKDVIVSINGTEYENYIKAINYSDFSVLNMYGQRDLNSTVAGSISEIPWMEDIINKTLEEANPKKLVIGIAAYSILWTEKNSNVIDAEMYNLSATQDYISKNNLETKYSEITKQNYIELKKGSLVYKMWVEDKISIKNRMDIIKSNNIMGVAIYKLGYENNEIIESIKR